MVALSNGNVPALASFASLRLRANGLTPLWQEGSDGGGRLAGCVASVEVVKSRMSAPGKSTAIRVLLPDVAGSWPVDPGAVDLGRPFIDRYIRSSKLERSRDKVSAAYA